METGVRGGGIPAGERGRLGNIRGEGVWGFTPRYHQSGCKTRGHAQETLHFPVGYSQTAFDLSLSLSLSLVPGPRPKILQVYNNNGSDVAVRILFNL